MCAFLCAYTCILELHVQVFEEDFIEHLAEGFAFNSTFLYSGELRLDCLTLYPPSCINKGVSGVLNLNLAVSELEQQDIGAGADKQWASVYCPLVIRPA